MTRFRKPPASEHDLALQNAFSQALAFPLTRASALALPPAQATELAEQEAAFRTVSIDEDGMSGGMRTGLLQPVRAVMTEWRQLREAFRTLLQPKMADIEGVERLQEAAAEEIRARDASLEAVERELRQSARYEDIDRHKQRAEILYEEFLARHGNRAATLFARTPVYWFLIFLVGVTEWFINYGAFYTFFGIPAFATGTTIVLAVLLALSSHGHGELLKQWSHRFGAERDPARRWTDWRLLGLATLGVIVVLGFTGSARYVAALDLIGSQAQTSALGDLGMVRVDPLRDVVISLLANVGAWIVGVTIAYLAHDADPDYMAATKQYRRARRRWNRARAGHVVRLRHIEARHARAIRDKTTAAETRLAAVAREIDMLKQVAAHDAAVQTELQSVLAGNLEVYRDALARIALARGEEVQLIRDGTRAPVSPFDYKAMRLAPERMMSQVAA